VLLTTLREIKTMSPCLRAAIHRVTEHLVDAAFDMVVKGAALPAGWETDNQPHVVGAIVKKTDSFLIERALEAYARVTRGQLARFRPGGSAAKAAAGRWGGGGTERRMMIRENNAFDQGGGFGDTLPPTFDDAEGPSLVLLFVVNATFSEELAQSVADLAARGAEACLLTFVVSKTTMGRLLLLHPGLKIVTATVQQPTSGDEGGNGDKHSSSNDDENKMAALPIIRLERLVAEAARESDSQNRNSSSSVVGRLINHENKLGDATLATT